MKTPLLALALLSLLLFQCSDDDCATCPDGTPAQIQVFPIVGYWCAEACEGVPLDTEPMSHSLTLRNNGTYSECDSTESVVTYHGTYRVSGDSLILAPMNARNRCLTIWMAQVGAEKMTLKRRCTDKNPAWEYVRSTSN